jgi:hypothetical protein
MPNLAASWRRVGALEVEEPLIRVMDEKTSKIGNTATIMTASVPRKRRINLIKCLTPCLRRCVPIVGRCWFRVKQVHLASGNARTSMRYAFVQVLPTAVSIKNKS